MAQIFRSLRSPHLEKLAASFLAASFICLAYSPFIRLLFGICFVVQFHERSMSFAAKDVKKAFLPA